MEVSGQLHAPGCFSPPSKELRYILDREIDGTKRMSVRFEVEKNCHVRGFELRFVHPVAQSPHLPQCPAHFWLLSDVYGLNIAEKHAYIEGIR